ncbi:hypothetical protein [Viscerimonas tarda]
MKNKLSALEELRAEKTRLREECNSIESRIGKNIYYVKNNFASLLVSSVFNTARKSIASLFGISSSSTSLVSNSILSSFPSVWNIARPFVMGWITKRITSFLFRKKK